MIRRPPSRTAIVLLACAGCGGGEPLREVAADLGVDFTRTAPFSGGFPIGELVGSGCAAFDADGDGRLDLYFLDGGEGPGRGAPNRFFRQQPDGTFRDETAQSGLGDRGCGTGVAVADVDNDGDPDVYVGNWGPDVLYLNEGGRFAAVPAERSGVRVDGLTASVAVLDYDLDGFLDLFVTRYVDPQAFSDGSRPSGLIEYLAPVEYTPVGDVLLRNRGDGTFEDATHAAGLAVLPSPGLGVVAEDFDGDGWTDVYVANDGVRNQLWINRRDGTFVDQAVAAGVAFDGQGVPEASMGIAVADADGDGHRDIFLSHVAGESHTYYRGGRRCSFLDSTGRAGLAAAGVPLTGWGAQFLDLELDGDLDLALVNGTIRALAVPRPGPAPAPWTAYAEPRQLFVNRGDGTFDDLSASVPSFGGPPEPGRGLLAADLEGDGDLDLVVTNLAGPVRIFENVAPRKGSWLAVRAVDPALRRDAIGARVDVTAGGRSWSGFVGAGGSYLCSGPPLLHFGLGPGHAAVDVVVTWPGGTKERFAVEGLGCSVVLEKGSGKR